MTKLIQVNFSIPMSEEGYKKLKELGFDFERNISLYLRDVYFEIRKCEEKQNKRRKNNGTEIR